jgi:hypothetical protein
MSSPTGKGGYLYVLEGGYNSSFVFQAELALMQIPADGCPAEVGGSPYAFPPRQRTHYGQRLPISPVLVA